MANGLLDEGPSTNKFENELKNETLLPYLNKHKLPVNNFTENGIVIQDLKNFDFAYFDDMCRDLKLHNTVQKIRFKKLIQELNDIKHSQISSEIKRQMEHAENEINKSFNSLINEIKARKHGLIDELHNFALQKLNNNRQQKTNIRFIFDDKTLRQAISKFGSVCDIESDLKPPIIEASINNDSIIINFKDYNDKQMQNMEFCVEYKTFECDNENDGINEEKKSMDKNCSIVQNSLRISNIKPLTKYYIRAKYSIHSTVWSEYSNSIIITSTFDCIWDKSQHTNANNLQFGNNNKQICCNARSGMRCIVSEPTFNGNILKKVKFEFIIDEFCQTSMFGLISEPINDTMHGYWTDNPISLNKHSLILETMNGKQSIHRYQYGKDVDNTFFSSSGISLSNEIKNGDHFIFNIDFDQRLCNVYINVCDDMHKICGRTDITTWTNINNKMVAVYGHSGSSRLMKKRSIVQIKLLSCEVR
eukprot:242972_1